MLLEKSCGGSGDAERKDGAVDQGDRRRKLGDGVSGDGGELLKGAVGWVGDAVAVTVAEYRIKFMCKRVMRRIVQHSRDDVLP